MSKKITIELTYEEYDKLMEIFTEKIKKTQPNATFQEFINSFFKMSLNSHYQIMNMTDNMFGLDNSIANIFDQFKNTFGASSENEPSISELMELMKKMNLDKTKKPKEQKKEDKKENKETFYKS